MKTVKGDLLELDHNIDAAAHVANLFHTFGGGIAAQIAAKFPKVAEVDKTETDYGYRGKLGTFTKAKVENIWFYNLYAMPSEPGNDTILGDRNLSYDYFYNGFVDIIEDLFEIPYKKFFQIGIPFKIGCGLAGGRWEVVKGLLEALETRFNQIVFVCFDNG